MRISSAFLLLSFGSVAHAQVTITESMLPIGTFTDRLYAVSNPSSAALPSDGSNQTWDLSALSLQEIGTFTHGPASGTPHAASYPTANLAWNMDMGLGSNYTYFHATPSGMAVVATDVPTDPEVYSNPMQVMAFPLAFNGTFTDTWMDTDDTDTVTWEYRGHGTAITPMGTFANVVKMVNDDDDVVLWRTSPLVPLFLSLNGVLLAIGPPATGIDDLHATRLNAYPVPCHATLRIQSAAAAPWRILDTQGRTVDQGRFLRDGANTIATDALLPGTYMLHVADSSFPQVARFVKQ